LKSLSPRKNGKLPRQKAPHPHTVQETLDILPTFLSSEVTSLLRAALVCMGVDFIFAEHRRDFWTNPANTFTYMGLRAVEDQSVVAIYETLKNEIGMFTLPPGLRRMLELKHHRHAISHPMSIDWDPPEMQRFAQQHRRWTDLRAAIVLDLVRSIDEQRLAHSLPPTDLGKVDVVPEMAAQECTILRFSLKPESTSLIPSEPCMIGMMEELRDRWLTFLAERPDGRPRPKATT
jgi:hypothetical protein